MRTYHIWTIGCQMNKAESDDVASYLQTIGYEPGRSIAGADIIILNTCVVRQRAENRVIGTLQNLSTIKKRRPDATILVTGCFVESTLEGLKSRFPFVDLFFPPGDIDAMRDWCEEHGLVQVELDAGIASQGSGHPPTAYVPIMQGCNNFCSYCIVPYRRGRERSRPATEIVCEIEKLVGGGVKEVTLLGQNVNSYGSDLPAGADLSDLLMTVNSIDGLARIRFLTNHPKDMDLKLIETIASLEKVCRHINIPLQSGDNDMLRAMRRGYTAEEYRRLIGTIMSIIPDVSLSTDLIVGFPNETEEQFRHSLDLIKDIRFDMVHVATYSPRPGTLAASEFNDNVTADDKKMRLHAIEQAQTQIQGEINDELPGCTLEVLVEGSKGGKWFGRTRSDKIVFFSYPNDCYGTMVYVRITKASPFSLQGELVMPDPANVGRETAQVNNG